MNLRDVSLITLCLIFQGINIPTNKRIELSYHIIIKWKDKQNQYVFYVRFVFLIIINFLDKFNEH